MGYLCRKHLATNRAQRKVAASFEKKEYKVELITGYCQIVSIVGLNSANLHFIYLSKFTNPVHDSSEELTFCTDLSGEAESNETRFSNLISLDFIPSCSTCMPLTTHIIPSMARAKTNTVAIRRPDLTPTSEIQVFVKYCYFSRKE